MSLQCTQERRADSLIIRLIGHLDGTTVAAFEKELFTAIGERPARIALDAQGLAYVASAGLGVLLRAARALSQLNGRLTVFGLPDDVQKVFEISGFTKVLGIYRSETEALAGVADDAR